MKHFGKSGAMIAAAALSFAISSLAVAPAQAEDAKVRRVGVNSCKGQGFLTLTKAECDTVGGKVGG